MAGVKNLRAAPPPPGMGARTHEESDDDGDWSEGEFDSMPDEDYENVTNVEEPPPIPRSLRDDDDDPKDDYIEPIEDDGSPMRPPPRYNEGGPPSLPGRRPVPEVPPSRNDRPPMGRPAAPIPNGHFRPLAASVPERAPPPPPMETPSRSGPPGRLPPAPPSSDGPAAPLPSRNNRGHMPLPPPPGPREDPQDVYEEPDNNPPEEEYSVPDDGPMNRLSGGSTGRENVPLPPIPTQDDMYVDPKEDGGDGEIYTECDDVPTPPAPPPVKPTAATRKLPTPPKASNSVTPPPRAAKAKPQPSNVKGVAMIGDGFNTAKINNIKSGLRPVMSPRTFDTKTDENDNAVIKNTTVTQDLGKMSFADRLKQFDNKPPISSKPGFGASPSPRTSQLHVTAPRERRGSSSSESGIVGGHKPAPSRPPPSPPKQADEPPPRGNASPRVAMPERAPPEPPRDVPVEPTPSRNDRNDRGNARPLPAVPGTDVESTLYSYLWYHGKLDRKSADSKVTQMGKNGAFLIRKSQRGGSDTPYTLVLYYNNRVWNLHIRLREDQKYAIGHEKEGEQTFSNIQEIVKHHEDQMLQLASANGGMGGETRLMSYPKRT